MASPFPILSISPVLKRGTPSLLELTLLALLFIFSRVVEVYCSDAYIDTGLSRIHVEPD